MIPRAADSTPPILKGRRRNLFGRLSFLFGNNVQEPNMSRDDIEGRPLKFCKGCGKFWKSEDGLTPYFWNKVISHWRTLWKKHNRKRS